MQAIITAGLVNIPRIAHDNDKIVKILNPKRKSLLRIVSHTVFGINFLEVIEKPGRQVAVADAPLMDV